MTHENGMQILTMMRGYQVPCILAAAVDLEIFESLANSTCSADQLATRLHCNCRAITVLLDGLASLGLLTKIGSQYILPESLRPYLTEGAPDSVLPMLRHQATCLRRWVRLPWTVQSGQPAETEPSLRGEESDQTAFIQAMDVVSRPVAESIIHEINPGGIRCLLDLGGGPATWTLAWLKEEPTARAILFDLPHVIPIARRRIDRATDGPTAFGPRITLVPGDFNDDPLPTGADLVWVSAIIHQNSRTENQALFQRIAETFDRDGGWIYIRDMVMDPTRTEPIAGALFAINMLVATPGGSCWTFAEIQADLESAGFVDIERIRHDDGMHSIIRARCPRR